MGSKFEDWSEWRAKEMASFGDKINNFSVGTPKKYQLKN
tara:strand:- start:1298 stop:1414 length:117 start_codon:yes stop_codon:yes gene_type:complete